MANAMRWVKETLAPVVRDNDSLSAVRLISSRRADTERTLVAVGTPRLACMFVTIRAAAPRSGVAPASMTTDLTGAGADCTVGETLWIVVTAGRGERW